MCSQNEKDLLAKSHCQHVNLTAETIMQAITLVSAWLAVIWTTRRDGIDDDSSTFRPRSTDAVHREATIISSIIHRRILDTQTRTMPAHYPSQNTPLLHAAQQTFHFTVTN